MMVSGCLVCTAMGIDRGLGWWSLVVLVVLWITVRRRECAPLQEGDVAGT